MSLFWCCKCGCYDEKAVLDSLNAVLVPATTISTDDFLLAWMCLNLCNFAYHTGEDFEYEKDLADRFKLQSGIQQYKGWYAPNELVEEFAFMLSNDLEDAINGSLAFTGLLSDVNYTITEPTLFVSFRGTRGLSDIIFDAISVLDCDFVTDKGTKLGQVGEGILHQYKRIKQLHGGLIPYIVDIVNTGATKEVVICGHSLGGGMATLLAAELATDHPEIIFSVVTFGGARALHHTVAAALSLDRKFLRFLHVHDLIPVLGYDTTSLVHIGVPCVLANSMQHVAEVKKDLRFNWIPPFDTIMDKIEFFADKASIHRIESEKGYFKHLMRSDNYKNAFASLPDNLQRRYQHFPLLKNPMH